MVVLCHVTWCNVSSWWRWLNPPTPGPKPGGPHIEGRGRGSRLEPRTKFCGTQRSLTALPDQDLCGQKFGRSKRATDGSSSGGLEGWISKLRTFLREMWQQKDTTHTRPPLLCWSWPVQETSYKHANCDTDRHTYRQHLCVRVCNIHTDIHTYRQTYINTYIHTNIHTCIQTYIHTCMHT